MVQTATARKTIIPALENGVAFRLQQSLVELIDLAIHAKQAHWNVVGPNFRSLHAQFDELVDTARLGADAVAERLAALQVSPHGSIAAVCDSPLDPFPEGWLEGPAAVKAILARIDHASNANSLRIKEIGDIDPVTETILLDIATELDKAAWMLRVQEE